MRKKAKIDPTVRKETLYIGVAVLILSALMEAAFLIIGKWDYTVLLGNLLSGCAAVLNFFLMGITVQNVVGREEKEIVSRVRLSQVLRYLMLFAVAILGLLLPCFNLFSVLIPLFFPRIAASFRPLFLRQKDK